MSDEHKDRAEEVAVEGTSYMMSAAALVENYMRQHGFAEYCGLALRSEILEQARLLGMSGERECALRGKLDAATQRAERAEAEREALRKQLREIGATIPCATGGTFENDPPDAILDALKRELDRLAADGVVAGNILGKLGLLADELTGCGNNNPSEKDIDAIRRWADEIKAELALHQLSPDEFFAVTEALKDERDALAVEIVGLESKVRVAEVIIADLKADKARMVELNSALASAYHQISPVVEHFPVELWEHLGGGKCRGRWAEDGSPYYFTVPVQLVPAFLELQKLAKLCERAAIDDVMKPGPHQWHSKSPAAKAIDAAMKEGKP